METGDLRYLLKLKNYDKFPEYNQELLIDAWDSIIEEHEKDSNVNDFSKSLMTANYSLREKTKIEGLHLSMLLLFINPESAKEKIKEFGININVDNTNEILKSIEKIENTIKSIDTRARIKALKERNKPKFKNPYYDIVYILEDQLKSFDEQTLTLKKMDILLKNIELKNKKIVEIYGRKD